VVIDDREGAPGQYDAKFFLRRIISWRDLPWRCGWYRVCRFSKKAVLF